ncbi:MAG: single-stranded-DNA-specific exonuclease RecJ [Candidatus Spyradocola sp.]
MLEFRRRAKLNEEAVAVLQGMGLPLRVAQLMALRGITNERDAKKYLHPSLDDLYDPYMLSDMDKAVRRIREAQEKKQRVCIYGDYDADGVTATSLLLLYFRAIGIDAGYYIPDRHEEGYGLNVAAVRQLAKQYDLMVTVDCGVTAVEEVRLARELGLDVVVTDHHHADETLPDCPIVNPRLRGYPFPYLAGVGVAAKLVQAMGGMDALRPYLDIVAIGTVADIVSLTDENRALVQSGLAAASHATRPGLLALMEVAGLRGKPLTSSSIGFALGPRINAGGRIGHSSRSVEMLCTQDMDLARKIADELENHNQIRQSQEQAIMVEALAQIEEKADFINDRVLVVVGENWNAGVIGIVASRLVERYNRPAFVLAREKDTYVGSARSIRGVPLFDHMQNIADVFVRYGGHDMAAGLTIESRRLDEFKRRINDEMLLLDDSAWIPSQDYDLEMRLPELTLEFLDSLECMQPMGQGNTTPVYLLRGVTVSGARTMGANNAHLRMQISQDGCVMDAAAFKMGWRAGQAVGLMDMLVTIDRNEWQGRTTLRLYVKQFKPSDEHYFTNLQQTDEQRMRDFLSMVMYNDSKPRFRRYLTLKEDAAAERVAHLLRGNLSGTLLLYGASETARVWSEKLGELGLLGRVGRSVGREPDDRCAYNLMTSPAYLSAKQFGCYRNIVLLDGAVSNAFVEKILEVSPNAVVLALPMQKELKDALRGAAPDVARVRQIYRALRASQRFWAGAANLAQVRGVLEKQLPVKLPELHIALCELRDMELAEYSDRPFRLRLVEAQGKKDFNTTATVRWLEERIQ